MKIKFSKEGLLVIGLTLGLGSGFIGGMFTSFHVIMPIESVKESMIWTAASSYIRGCQKIASVHNLKAFEECKNLSVEQINDTTEILNKEPIQELKRRADKFHSEIQK